MTKKTLIWIAVAVVVVLLLKRKSASAATPATPVSTAVGPVSILQVVP